MKQTVLGFAAVCAMLFSSCNEEAKLARDIEGTWSGAPEVFVNDASSRSTIIETFTFERDTTKSGTVMIGALVSSTGAVQGTDAIVQPFSVSAAAKSTISGRWQVIDDDELVLTLDPSTMKVEVDPSAVVLTTNLLTGAEAPSTESLRPQMAEAIRSNLSHVLAMRYLSYRKLDDVKVKDKGTMLKFEVGKQDYILSRQGPATGN